KFEDKLPDFTDPILSISTIASAIANASASADPFQLAAMIMALSNKSREKPFLPEAGKDTDLSFINQPLSSNEEKHNAFNMEKYLKKTEAAGHESEPENFTRSDVSVHDLIWDSSLPYTHKSQDTQAADLLNSNLLTNQQGGKWFLDFTESFYEENGTQDSSCASNFPENRKKTVNRAEPSEKSSDLITEKEMVYIGKGASLKQFASQTNSLTNSHINYSNENKETAHRVMNNIVPRSSNDSVKRATTESTVSTNSLKLVQQPSIPLPISHTKAKSTQKLSKDEERQGGNMQKRIREASATCNNFVKHVTFEKPSVTSPKSIDQKPTSSECDLQSSEDEQYSFRPSTSPLIHSSPSEVSGTTLSGSEADSPCTAPSFQRSACNDSTLTQSVCSNPSMSRLTYVSATDNTLKNIAITPSAARHESNNASELSTTIIRASPTPLVEQTTEKPEDFSWQRNRRGTSLNTSQRNVNKKSEASDSTGHVRVPEELKFPNACCVGIASQTNLGIFNPTERWLQVSIGIFSISINGEKNAVAWRCFTFSKEPVNTSIECSPQTDAISQLAAPSVVNHVIHASYDGQDPESLVVWVLFHAPKKQISLSDTLGPADEFLARVDVEVDSPGPTSVIKSIPLRARAGTARIHAPKDLQAMCLSASVGSSAKQQLPLKNAGNIEVYLKIKTSGQDNCISVEPEDLFLMPGEEQDVAVLFSPKDLKTSSESQQKLTLRNNSPSATQHLRLLIRGQDQNCFQVSVMQTSIPLSGYGGTSNVILENVKKLSDSYMVTLNELLPDKLREVSFLIRNMGSRAAYVKALCFRDLQSKAVMDPKAMIVSPEKFVLKEGTQEVVTVTCNCVEREEMLHKTSTSLLSTICFFCGDEVSRQQYRRAVLYKPEAAKQILPENSMLRNITFDEKFQGEQLVTEVYDLPQRTNDIELFYGNMRKVILSVVGDAGESSFKRNCLQQSAGHSLESDRTSILILVSPNPSLATKPSVFPWSGLIYIHCDNGQKFIKVQIREDIAQDVSSAGSISKKLDVLTPASESVIHMIKPLPKLPSTNVEIKNRTIIFPETGFGESSENYLEIENHGNEDVKWHLSSFAPPYVKGVDESGDVYRATYTAFRCSRVSGTLGAHGKEKVAIIFLPRDRGDYAQFWDLECHPLAEPHMKHKLRFQLSGVGAKTENEAVNAKLSTCALIKTEIPVMPRRRAGSEASALKTGQNEVIRGVYAREDQYTFLPTRVGESSTLKVNLRNNTFITHMCIKSAKCILATVASIDSWSGVLWEAIPQFPQSPLPIGILG
ncbi:hypothetical protein UY3_10824, partial [Chelonia mydas]